MRRAVARANRRSAGSMSGRSRSSFTAAHIEQPACRITTPAGPRTFQEYLVRDGAAVGLTCVLTADRAVPGGRLAALARQRLVLPLPETLHPWVERNVIPYLQSIPVGFPGGQTTRLSAAGEIAHYLEGDDEPVIVADWPDDIAHFCSLRSTASVSVPSCFQTAKSTRLVVPPKRAARLTSVGV